MSPGLRPAAAAMAAKLALVGSAAVSPGAASITWPVARDVAMDVGVCETSVWIPALLSMDGD